MYILRQTQQAPLQCNWCGNGLQVIITTNQRLANVAGSTPVFISPSGSNPSVYTNKKGDITYTFQKAGTTTGTSSGTASASTAFTDTVTNPNTTGTTTYTLTINDASTGQKYVYVNSIGWGAV